MNNIVDLYKQFNASVFINCPKYSITFCRYLSHLTTTNWIPSIEDWCIRTQ